MTEHTKEPWTVTDNNWDVSTIYDCDGEPVCECHIDGNADEDTQDQYEREKEDRARRIVAAVNSLSGIPTEALEAGIVGEMVAAIKLVRQIICDGAESGFNPLSGDWAERLYQSQAVTFKFAKLGGTNGK